MRKILNGFVPGCPSLPAPDCAGQSLGSGGTLGSPHDVGGTLGSPQDVWGRGAIPGMCGDTCEPPGCKGTLGSPGPGLGGVGVFVTLLQVGVGAGGALPGTGQLWGAACPITPGECPAASASPGGGGKGLGVLVLS